MTYYKYIGKLNNQSKALKKKSFVFGIYKSILFNYKGPEPSKASFFVKVKQKKTQIFYLKTDKIL